MLTPAAVYDVVGGFTTLLPGNYNDVDYCMKLRHAGYDIVYEPACHAVPLRVEVTRRRHHADEIELIQRRWLSKLLADPFTPAFI